MFVVELNDKPLCVTDDMKYIETLLNEYDNIKCFYDEEATQVEHTFYVIRNSNSYTVQLFDAQYCFNPYKLDEVFTPAIYPDSLAVIVKAGTSGIALDKGIELINEKILNNGIN